MTFAHLPRTVHLMALVDTKFCPYFSLFLHLSACVRKFVSNCLPCPSLLYHTVVLTTLWVQFTFGKSCWQTFTWFPASPHPPTLRWNNPTKTELFNSGILHLCPPTPPPHTHMAGDHGWGFLCVCVCGGGRVVAWVHLSTLLLFDGTQCAFIHYSCHAEGATLGQGFGKSMPEPFIMSTGKCVYMCACTVYVCVFHSRRDSFQWH